MRVRADLSVAAWAVVVGSAMGWGHVARGQSLSAELSAALDRQMSLKLAHTLPNAVRLINEKTGVRIEVDPVAYDILPWGDQTNITANIENLTLREALSAITRKLGLKFEVGDTSVRVEPIPAAMRVGKRLTLDELTLLDILFSSPLKHTENNLTLRQIIEATDGALAQVGRDSGGAGGGSGGGGGGYVVESHVPVNREGTASPLETLIPVSRNATLADALEAIPRSTDYTWYPWGKSVVVLKKEDQIRLLLQKRITVRYGSGATGVDVNQVLLDLSKATRVPFSIEVGALQRIPPEFRMVRLTIDEAPVEQVLEQLKGATGLNWAISDRVGKSGGVYLWAGSAELPGSRGGTAGAAGSGAGGGAGSRSTLLVPLSDGTQIIVPDSELPDDVKEYLRAKRKAEVEKLREQMRQEGFRPTTKPAEESRDL